MRTNGLICVAVVLLTTTALAADPAAMKAEANNAVTLGQSLVNEAERLLKGEKNFEALKVALSLYARAGQSFEKAANLYRSLFPDYASKGDVENAAQAVDYCLAMMKDIRGHAGAPKSP